MEGYAAKRLLWVDYMKVIGMYLIIAGHFFTIGNKYIYTFSVALFFCISGFLCKKEREHSLFWKKLWYNLVIPMFFICILNLAWKTQSEIRHNTFNVESLCAYFLYLICGFHKALGPMWFVYTLIFLKLIFQFSSTKLHYILLFISPIMTITANHFLYGTFEPSTEMGLYANAIANTTISFPFFIIGNYIKRYKVVLNLYKPTLKSIFIVIICTSIIFVCGRFNDIVFMYLNGFGSNYIMFIMGSISGTILIFIISKYLSCFKSKQIIILSTGSIAILGFHMIILNFTRSILTTPSWKDYIMAVGIMILFIPIIFFLEKFSPFLLGKYRIK